jgi:hypothetical protein
VSLILQWDAPAAVSGVSSRIRVLIREETLGRGLEKEFWMGGRSPPHASRPLIGREVPIFQKFTNRHPFFKFNFLTFFKKNFCTCTGSPSTRWAEGSATSMKARTRPRTTWWTRRGRTPSPCPLAGGLQFASGPQTLVRIC